MNSELEHHTVIVVGGGPAGLPLAVVLGGWHPLFRDSPVLRQRYPQIAEALYQQEGSLLGLDFRDLVRSQIPPVDLFRVLHHPRQLRVDESQIAMEFRRQEALDVLLITQEEVGGLWNNVPEALLTLSPGHWMEFPFYSLATHARESGWVDFDVNELIIKHRLVDYYHRIPERFEVANRIHTWERVVRVEPHERGFLVTSVDVSDWKDADPQQLRRPAFPQSQEDVADAETRQYTCKYLVYAVGQRGVLRELGVPGEHLPFVTQFYDRPEHFPGERVMVVGGGRSADWAATELHDAGRQVNYVMRQPEHLHWALINQSRGGLPYYARIAEILEEPSPRLESLYDTQIVRIDAEGEGGVVTVKSKEGGERKVKVDHLLKEIGGRADYSLLQGFDHGGVKLVDKRDNYRFQVHQLPVHPHNYESIQIPNLYPGGYLAEGLGLVVIAMHGTTYAIAADILRKEGAEA